MKPSVAAQELKRKEIEFQAQNEIRERRRKELQQQRQLKLTKTMTDDLQKTLLPLLQQGAAKSDVISTQKQRKLFWAKESKLGAQNDTFRRLWAAVGKNVQNSKFFRNWLNDIEGLSSDSDNDTSPWAHLWYPNYNGKRFAFDEWDTFKYIDSLSD